MLKRFLAWLGTMFGRAPVAPLEADGAGTNGAGGPGPPPGGH